jgi:DNA-binding response OmpR family regulator
MGIARTRIPNLDALEVARTLGADDVIAKPFEPEMLLDRLARLSPDFAGACAISVGLITCC